MLMTNIPRRKIYETMLEYEEAVLEIQILIQSDENFKKYYDIYGSSIIKAKEEYKNIKALLVLFFENKQFEKEEDFENSLKYYLKEEKEVNDYLKKRKGIRKSFRKVIEKLDCMFTENNEIRSLEDGKKMFRNLDEFNSEIPKILEIRRDKMK